jgi:hypothetical protein
VAELVLTAPEHSVLRPILTPSEFSVGTGGKISSADPRVPPLLDGATAAIRRYCGWHIGPELIHEDVYLDGDGGQVLMLPTMRLLGITSLSTYARREGSPYWRVFNSSEIDELEWSTLGMVRYRSWPARWRGIRVTFVHGFSSDELAGLKQVIQQVVANAIVSPLGATREQAGALGVSWSTTAPGVSGGISLLQRDLDLVNTFKLPARA